MCDWYDVGCGLSWFSDELKLLFLWAYDSLLTGFVTVIDLIPAPDFLTVGTVSLPPTVAYYAEAFKIREGIGIVVTAYTARFILRRIPGIG